MKGLKLIILLIFSFTSVLKAQDVPKQVVDAFSLGKSDMLSTYLAEEVELIILEDEGLFSKDMTKKKLNEFFTQTGTGEFKIVHSGESPSKSNYVIGELNSQIELFRIYLLFSGKNWSNISEIRIESDE